jgi:hypothetical protein
LTPAQRAEVRRRYDELSRTRPIRGTDARTIWRRKQRLGGLVTAVKLGRCTYAWGRRMANTRASRAAWRHPSPEMLRDLQRGRELANARRRYERDRGQLTDRRSQTSAPIGTYTGASDRPSDAPHGGTR